MAFARTYMRVVPRRPLLEGPVHLSHAATVAARCPPPPSAAGHRQAGVPGLGFGGLSAPGLARPYVQVPSAGKGFGQSDRDPKDLSTAEQLINTMSEISAVEGREAETRNMVMGGDNTPKSWEEMDAKVNEYPCERGFKAIGTGDDDFKQAMVAAVERTLGVSVSDDQVTVRPSKKGTYVSVNITGILVQSGEEVKAVYAAMKEDPRLKWFI